LSGLILLTSEDMLCKLVGKREDDNLVVMKPTFEKTRFEDRDP
jgi:hypothetical protein